MVEPVEIPVRARQRVMEELLGLANVQTDPFGFVATHEADRHRHDVALPARKESSRSLGVVKEKAGEERVAVVVEGEVAVGDEHVIAGQPRPGTNPRRTKAGRGEAFEERMSQNVTGSGREEDPIRKVPAPEGIFLDTGPQEIHGAGQSLRSKSSSIR